MPSCSSGGGQITNNSGAIIQGVRGINITGPDRPSPTLDRSAATAVPAVLLGGAGNSVLDQHRSDQRQRHGGAVQRRRRITQTLTNTGQINGSGTAVQFNTVAGFSLDFQQYR